MNASISIDLSIPRAFSDSRVVYRDAIDEYFFSTAKLHNFKTKSKLKEYYCVGGSQKQPDYLDVNL